MALLRVALFGEPRFAFDGAEYRFEAPPRALPLLTYLLLRGGALLDRGVVAAAMWPEILDDEARTNLRRHLHYIKRALPPRPGGEWLDITSKTVRVDPSAPLLFDVAEFERASRDQARRGDAIALYTGDLFARCEDEWIEFDRERLRAMQTANLEHLFGAAIAAREYDDAFAYAGRLLAHDPWREDVVRELIALRVRRGDRAGALAEYERFAMRLREEMDVDPMPETRAALEATPPAAPRIASRATPAIAGRDDEIRTLVRAWRAARDGRAQLAFIGGDAGAGKTTLAEEIVRVATTEGARELSGTASSDPSAPYQLFRDVLRGALAHHPTVADALRTRLAIVLPELEEGAARAEVSDEERARFFAAVGDVLEAVARKRPLVVRLEDAHWAGPAAALLLEYLVRRLATSPVFIVVTYREGDISLAHPIRALRRQFARAPGFTHVALRPLDAAAIESLASRYLGAAAGEIIADDILEATRGNAFFIVETLRALADDNDRELAGDVRGLVSRRIERASAPARTVSEYAALAGPSFRVDLLAALAELSERTVRSALDELVERRIVRTAGGDEFAFAHDLFREVVAERTDERRARAGHARLARLLSELDGTAQRAATIAYHAELGLLPDAAAWHVRAARHALSVYADDEALREGDRAVDLAMEPRERFEALLVLEDVYRRRGPRDRRDAALRELDLLAVELDVEARREVASRSIDAAFSADDLQRAERLLRELAALADDDVRNGEVAYWEAALALRRGSTDATPTLQRALTLLPARSPLGYAARALMIENAVFRGTATPSFVAVIASASADVDDPGARGRLLQAECRALLTVSPRDARRVAEDALELAVRAGDRLLEALAHRFISAAASYLNDVAAAREHIEIAARLIARYGNVADEVAVALSRGVVTLTLGRLDETLEIYNRALRLAEQNGLAEKRVQLLTNSSIAYAWKGDLASARRAVQRARDIAADAALHGFEGVLRVNTAWIAFQERDYARTIAELEDYVETLRALEQGDALGAALANLGVAYLAVGRAGDADSAARDARATFAKLGPSGWSRAQNLFYLACVERGLGRDDAARALLADAHAALRAEAEACGDPAAHDAIMALQQSREIVAAFGNDVWPEFTRRTDRAAIV